LSSGLLTEVFTTDLPICLQLSMSFVWDVLAFACRGVSGEDWEGGTDRGDVVGVGGDDGAGPLPQGELLL